MEWTLLQKALTFQLKLRWETGFVLEEWGLIPMDAEVSSME